MFANDKYRNCVEFQTIKRELKTRGFSVDISQREWHEIRIDVMATASQIIPEDTTKEVFDFTAKAPYFKPKNSIDYFKVWLTDTFPFLTAPLFIPKFEQAIAEVEVKQKVTTKYNRIYIGADRREYLEYVPTESPLVHPPLYKEE